MNRKLAAILFYIAMVIYILLSVTLCSDKNVPHVLLGSIMLVSGLLASPRAYFDYKSDYEKNDYLSTGTMKENALSAYGILGGVFILT